MDGNQMQYCLVINNQRNMKTFCEAIADKLGNGPSSCNKFDFLHDGFSANKRTRNLNAKRLGKQKLLYKVRKHLESLFL